MEKKLKAEAQMANKPIGVDVVRKARLQRLSNLVKNKITTVYRAGTVD